MDPGETGSLSGHLPRLPHLLPSLHMEVPRTERSVAVDVEGEVRTGLKALETKEVPEQKEARGMAGQGGPQAAWVPRRSTTLCSCPRVPRHRVRSPDLQTFQRGKLCFLKAMATLSAFVAETVETLPRELLSAGQEVWSLHPVLSQEPPPACCC